MTSPPDLAAFAADLDRLGPLVTFPWHDQQRVALASATNTVMVLGGNQGGKTQTGLGIVSRLVRREGPIWQRLRNRNRPLKIWVSPQTLEKYKSNWEDRLRTEALASMTFHYVQSPHPIFTWEDEYGGGTIWGKSQDQGFMAFESDVVDLVVFDEEPADKRLYTSAQQRVATTNGVIALTFTPLLGMSWTHGALYLPTCRPEYQLLPRVWKRGNAVTVIQMGMADNPAAVAGGGVVRLREDPTISEAEKRTRLYGDYGFTEGLIFPQFAGFHADLKDSPYLLDGLPDGPYSWVLTVDPNKRHGGLLTAIDHADNWIVVAEYYRENVADTLHGLAYRQLLAQHGVSPANVEVGADPGGAGAQAILNLAEVGVMAHAVPKGQGSVKASIERVRRALWVDPRHRHPVTGALGAPHLYFLRSLCSTWNMDGVDYHESRLFWELRQYRQKQNAPPDTPVKEYDDVVDPLRYLALLRPVSLVQPVDQEREAKRAQLDATSLRATDEFDKLVAQMTKPKSRRDELYGAL